MRKRLSIAGLMLVVFWIAVAIAALRTASRLWAGILLSTTLAALTYALLGALHTKGPARAFWSGFAVTGWLFLAVHYAPWFDEQVSPYLASTALCDIAYDLIHPREAATRMPPVTELRPVTETVLASGVPMTTTRMVSETRYVAGSLAPAWTWWSEPQTTTGTRLVVPTSASFRRVILSLLCLLLASLGGVVSRRFADAAPSSA